MKRSVIFTLLLATLSLTVSAEEKKKKLYKWVDKHGNVHYSDEPRKGAKELNIQEVPAIKMKIPKIKEFEPVEANNQSRESATNEAAKYQELNISFPENNGVIRNNGAVIELKASLKPALKDNHLVRFFLDGKPVKTASKSLNISIENSAYGEHQASVIVIDDKGKQIQTSKPIKFTLLHVINRNNRNQGN